ncbi:MAG: cell envelope integrity protein CreD [Acidobacteriota bacterium]|nr:cell envelope integrity protein CreD [Acidobacteriota bacterium]
MDNETWKNPIRRFGESAFGKLLMLGFLLLLLLLPVARITALVHERMSRQAQVASEITANWGRSQSLTGPVLSIPVWLAPPEEAEAAAGGGWVPAVEEAALDGAARKADDPAPVWRRHMVHVLPQEINWRGSLEPDVRYRGLFEVVVYEARIQASGTFEIPSVAGAGARPDWSALQLNLGISDVRGLQQRVELQWDGEELEFQPGAPRTAGISGGIHAELPELAAAQAEPGTLVPFAFELVLRGSGELLVQPLGESTHVELAGPWTSPGFVGAFLPTERQIDDDGFTAVWQVPNFGRDFPQLWWNDVVNGQELAAAGFGVELVLPADAYQQTERSVKYAVLFIVLTFGTFFLLELLSPVRLHAVQYLLIGFAQSLFYVLLLALAEHLGFGPAYALAAAATVGLIAVYSHSILAGRRPALAVFGCLGLLYGYLYILLQLEDYALLVGALGLFAALAALMLATRKLDWFTLRFEGAAQR